MRSDALSTHSKSNRTRTPSNRIAVRIGSRGSKLALWQANHVRDLLAARYPEANISIVIIKTTGDKILDQSLSKIGGKGLFTKEIEDALLKRKIDLAVHSLKDLPTSLPAGLRIGAITRREDVRDALLTVNGVSSVRALSVEARVGTSSLRRRAQLLRIRPDLRIEDLRGNLDTRVAKLKRGEYDAIMLAFAGLRRLGLGLEHAHPVPLTQILSAVGQGALAIETRVNDEQTNRMARALHHSATAAAVTAERALLAGLGGGCQVPIAAHARVLRGELKLRALVASVDGTHVVAGSARGRAKEAAAVGQRLARRLIAKGAGEILREILPELVP